MFLKKRRNEKEKEKQQTLKTRLASSAACGRKIRILKSFDVRRNQCEIWFLHWRMDGEMAAPRKGGISLFFPWVLLSVSVIRSALSRGFHGNILDKMGFAWCVEGGKLPAGLLTAPPAESNHLKANYPYGDDGDRTRYTTPPLVARSCDLCINSVPLRNDAMALTILSELSSLSRTFDHLLCDANSGDRA